MPDNEFIIDTTLDTRNAENNAESLNNRIKNMAKDIDKLSEKQKLAFQKSADSFNKSARAVENQKSKVQALSLQLEKMQGQQIPTDEYKEIAKQIEQAQLRLNKLNEQQDLFISNGGKEKTQTYKRRQVEIEQLIKTIAYAKGEQEELIQSGGAYTLIDSSKLESELANAKLKLTNLENDMNNKGVALNIKLDEAQSLSRFSKIINVTFNAVKKSAQITSNFIKKTFVIAFDGIKKASAFAFNSIKTGFSKLTGAFKNPKELSKPFDTGLKKLMKYGLGVRSVFALINKLRNALKEGLTNLANFNNGSNKVNKDLTSLKSNLTQIKNSLASAFAPLISIVVPMLNQLSNALNEIVTKIGMVISKLSGATSFIKAKKVVDKYADSVSNASKKLASFDELQTLDSDGGLSANDMFETVDLEKNDSVSSMADSLLNAWENADFSGFGAMIGEKISDALKNIPWSNIRQSANKLGTSLSSLINGMLKTDKLGYELGNNLANGINTALEFINSFLSEFDFASLGTFIGDSINGLLLNIDFETLGENFALKWNGIFETIGNANQTIGWTDIATNISDGINKAIETIDAEKIGKTIGETFKNAMKFLSTAIKNIEWYELGKTVSECISSVDWNGVADSFFELLGSSLGGLASFMWGVIEEAMNNLKEWWYENSFENGKFSISGLFEGIVDALSNVGTWIYDHIFTPFKEGFCEAFKIHSPSKFMAEMGGYIVQGLFDGINDKIDKVVKIWEDFKTTILGIFESLWEGLKGVINSIICGIESMANGVVLGINKVIDTLNNLEVEIPDWVPKFGGQSIGFDIGHMSEISIPKLATGTVVPRQASEFMAIMGDNNKETEVVSPLSTIKQALSEVMAEYGKSNGDVYISAEGDLDALVRMLKLKIDTEDNRVGRSFTKVMS